MLTKNVIRDTNELVGKAGDTTYPAKYVNYNTFIPKGSMFYRSAVVTWDKMPDSAWADVSEDYSLISLKVNSNTTYGNSIFPGDKIDLYYQNVNEEGKVFVGPLITGITVLAVKDVNGNHIFKRSAEQKDAAALIFAVKNDEFLFLKAAFYVSGSNVIPVPRNINYNPEMDSVIGKNDEYIYNFISKRIKISTEG